MLQDSILSYLHYQRVKRMEHRSEKSKLECLVLREREVRMYETICAGAFMVSRQRRSRRSNDERKDIRFVAETRCILCIDLAGRYEDGKRMAAW